MKKIFLYGLDVELVHAWKQVFAQECAFRELVEIRHGDILTGKADALVSPANSFGFMDGGIDLYYSQRLGWHVQERLQEQIKSLSMQELLVGQALAVPTDREQYPWLISAPTMRVPCVLSDSLQANAYLATRAATLCALEKGFESVAFPGMGTGTGKLACVLAARYMYAAFRDCLLEKREFPKTLWEATTNLVH